MHSMKTLLAAGTMTIAMMAGAAQAAPWDHRDLSPMVRHDTMFNRNFRDMRDNRMLLRHERVYDTLRWHRYRAIGMPVFVRGHYVVRSVNRFGRVVLVEINPYTGVFLGEIRI